MNTHIASEIDLERPGKQVGYLRLPNSVHRSAYGWLPVPVACIANRDGPTVLLMSGNHGDEYEGQIALSELICTLQPDDVKGRVLVLPMANFPAARAGLRTSPLDGGNLNRSFPGDRDGTLTSMLAHYIEHVLLPRCDLFIDLHSGGSSLMYVPLLFAPLDDNRRLDPAMGELATAFGAPITVVSPPAPLDRMSSSAAYRQGVMSFSTEMGGAGTVSPSTMAAVRDGLYRVLRQYGVLQTLPAGVPAPEATRMTELLPEHYTYSSEDGLFEPVVDLGDEVRSGDLAAYIHSPETPSRAPQAIRFEGEGIVVCKRVPARCERGDCLFHLANDWAP